MPKKKRQTKTPASRLEVALERLTEAQRQNEKRFGRVEAALERLAEAQARTEEQIAQMDGRLGRVEAALERLTQAQQRTEERLEALVEAQQRTEARVEALAQAQQRTEERLEALVEAQQRTEARVEALAQAQARTEERLAEAQRQTDERFGRVEAALERLAQAQQETEKELRELIGWQRGEDGRRRGERYERDVVRRAPVIFNGGQGGPTDQPWVQERVTEGLRSLLAGMLEVEDDPFLADLVWWKGEQVAIVEASIQVNGEDVVRAARRADTLKRAGLEALAIVIGDKWAKLDAREEALSRQVEWKVGSDVSDGFLAFRRAGHEVVNREQ